MKKLFTPEFKQQCLNLLLNERHTTIEVSKMMSVSISALQRWKIQYYKEKEGITPKTTCYYDRAARNLTSTGGS